MSDLSATASVAPLRGLRLARWAGVGACLIVLAAFPLISGREYPVFIATQIGVYLLVAMGLNLLTGYGGMPSLGHGALMALGSYSTALLMVDGGWSFWAAALVGIVVTSGVGAMMAIPALRVSAWYFALITLGFAEVLRGLLVEWKDLTHSFGGVVGIPMPSIGGYVFSSKELFWLVAALNVICFVMIARLVNSRIGRGLVALRDNPEAATASGISIPRLKLFAFLVSAAITGAAGAIFAVQKTVITPDDFSAEFSIFFLVVVVLGGGGRLWGPVIGTFVFFVVPELMTGLHSWRMLVYGGVLLVLMLFAPNGLAGALSDIFGRLRARLAMGAGEADTAPTTHAADDLAVQAPASGKGLTVAIADVVKTFGGVTALGGVSIEVAAGTVHAIVGPNGSGKTTLLNVISGFYRPDRGRILLGETDVQTLSPVGVARLGVGRTFQTPKLLPELSTLDNVMLGGFAAEHASTAEIALALPRALSEARTQRQEASRYLNFVGHGARALDLAGDLPHGQQRLVEVARALMGCPQVLLLDEPAAGLSLDELDKLASLIRSIRTMGITVVLVEHHLELVSNVCDRVSVLDRGKVLAEGSPQEVFENQAVIGAYMGARRLDVEAVAKGPR